MGDSGSVCGAAILRLEASLGSISTILSDLRQVRITPHSRHPATVGFGRKGPEDNIALSFGFRKGFNLALEFVVGTLQMKNRMAVLLLCTIASLTLSTGGVFADDEAVWATLKQGGKVILLRHTHVDIREGIGYLAQGNCAEEVNLSASGIAQAKRIGEAFQAHGIAVGEVLSSPYCRCIDTGKLAFGHATPVMYLRPPGTVSDDESKLNRQSVVQEILKHHGPSNLVMITHDLNIADVLVEDTVPMGEFFVVQPKGTDFDVIGKIRLGD